MNTQYLNDRINALEDRWANTKSLDNAITALETRVSQLEARKGYIRIFGIKFKVIWE